MELREVLDKVLQGDCIEVMKRLPPEIADMVFFDPHYFLQLPNKKKLIRWKLRTEVESPEEEWDKFSSYQEYDTLVTGALAEIKRIMKPKATIWAIGTYHNIFRVGKIMQDLGYWTLNDVIWLKSNPMPNWLNVRFTNATETLIWALRDRTVKGHIFDHKTAKKFGDAKIALNVWRLPICAGRERLKNDERRKLHPTQKPEKLLEQIILVSTNAGDLVFDPIAGTGTTGYVAKKLGRHFVMLEKEKRYVKAIEERLSRIGNGQYGLNKS